MAQRTPSSPRRWGKIPAFLLSLTLTLVLIIIYITSRPIFFLDAADIRLLDLGYVHTMLDLLEAKTLDMRFQWRGKRDPGNTIVIIGVDEKTERELGRWQSSGRQWIAQMLDILRVGGAKVVGFDVVLEEPGESAVVSAIDALNVWYREHVPEATSADPELLAAFETVKTAYDYDQQLAAAIERFGRVILGIYFFPEKEAAHLLPDDHARAREIIKRVAYKLIKFPAGQPVQPVRAEHFAGAAPNLSLFSDAAQSFGFFNALKYDDRYIRHTMLVLEYEGTYYPSLAVQMLRSYLNPVIPPVIHALPTGASTAIISEIQLGDVHIPTDEKGRLLLNYYGPGKTFTHYGLSDVVLGRVPPETFKDKIVLFGFTAAIYQDLHPTSFQTNYPGVETHATVIANILRQEFLSRPDVTVLFDALIILGCGVLLGVMLPRTTPVAGAGVTLLCLAGVIGGTHYAFLAQRIWLNMVYPLVFILLDYLTLTSYKYFTEEKKKREVKMAFQHYVSPVVVDQMLDRLDQLTLGGERKQLTAMFSDIRGFTSISEKMLPEELVKFLNEYLSAMTQIVLKYEGTVDKYMGDAIMAFFGAPLPQPDHAARACRTAVEMIARLNELREGWRVRGLPPMQIGIGLNSGDMSVGNMGSEERFDYTIMGDNVNLASRLEGINKQYGTQIVISQFTYQLVRHEPFIVRELDAVRVKGKQEPVVIYELVGYGTCEPAIQRMLHSFHEGVTAYQQRQWEQAIQSFQQALQHVPDDEPSRLYLQRCQEYLHSPPPEDWDGVFVMTTK